MLQRYAEIAFTDSVREAQRRYGGREPALGTAAGARLELGARERDFIAARDSFYLASVGDSGWPYIQHRGGPAGFLKVLAPARLGFADYGGNRQYVSAGNLGHDGRLCLFLMDYPNRRRLKIFGRAEISEALPAELLTPPAPAGSRIERAILIAVEAFDWNCPQHITPRYTESEWRTRLDRPTTTRSEQ